MSKRNQTSKRFLPMIWAVVAGVTPWPATSALAQGTTAPLPRTSADVVGLEQAIGEALQTSPLLKGSAALRQAQQERSRSAWADAGPHVSLGYSDVRYDEKQVLPLGNTPLVLRDDKTRLGNVQVTQPITGLYGLIERAHYEGEQENLKRNDYEIAKRDTVFKTAELYVRAQAAQKMLEVAADAIKAAESQANDGESLYRVGSINQGDLLKLKLALSEARSRAAQALATKETVFAGLSESIQHGSPATLRIEEFDHTHLPKDVTLPTPEDAIQASQNANLERENAVIAKEISLYGRKLAIAQFLPSASVFARVDHDFLLKQDTKSYGLQVTWDIWSNGSTVFSLREAGQQINAADAQLQGVEQKMRIDFYQTIATASAQKSGLELADLAVEQAEEAYRIEKSKFASGKSSATDLVESQASLTNARGNLVTAYTEFQVTYFNLLKLQGRPFQRLAAK